MPCAVIADQAERTMEEGSLGHGEAVPELQELQVSEPDPIAK
jgi:hypothetical protein